MGALSISSPQRKVAPVTTRERPVARQVLIALIMITILTLMLGPSIVSAIRNDGGYQPQPLTPLQH